MELRHLRYFVTVAEELNFSRASARLRVSQPAVSKQIRDLESEIGSPLFLRAKQGIALTEAGTLFLSHARRLLRAAHDAVESVRGLSASTPHSLRISYIAPAMASFLGTAMRTFSKTHPQVALSIVEMSPRAQVKALDSGEVDLALIGNPCPQLHEKFHVTVLQRIPLEVALPENHRLTRKKRIALHELKSEPFVILSEETFPGRKEFLLTTCRQHGFTPRITRSFCGISELFGGVGAGMGISLVPRQAGLLAHPHCTLLPLQEKIMVEFAALQPLATPNPLASIFLKIIP